jgi:competence ComEA-like helix-hairpin-helix protein
MEKRWLMSAALVLLLAGGGSAAELLNLNSATKGELVALGLSDSQALQVIGHRDKNGPFLQVEELMAVPQMTKAMFEKIHTRLTVDE